MTSYTGKDRILAAHKGERTDHTPFNVDIGPHYAPVLNYSTGDYFANIETAIECQVKSVADFTSDIITVPQNVMSWFRVSSCYRFQDSSREVKDSCIKEIQDMEGLEPFPVSDIQSLSLLMESCKKISELTPQYASRVAVLGPIWDAAFLVGFEDWVVTTQENPEFIHRLMRLTTEATKARALEVVKKAEVLIVVVADTFASISNISPTIYNEFVFPYEMEVFEELRAAAGGSKIIGLHICGFIDPIMKDVARLPLDWIELDGPSSLEKMFEAAENRIVIRGNIGGEIFSDGSRQDIFEAVKKCLETASGSNKYVLSTGCQIPLNAPLGQVRHFISAAQQYGTDTHH